MHNPPSPSSSCRILELPVQGMDCAECTQHVRHALAAVPGVESVEVFLTSEKAVVRVHPEMVELAALRQAVAAVGYHVPETAAQAGMAYPSRANIGFVLTLLGVVVGAVVLILVVGEWLGLFARVTEGIPWFMGLAIVLLAGAPIFWNVVRAAWHRQVISHTLMSLGVLAALVIGQWPTAAVVVFFMHIGNFVESFTTQRSRQAVKQLTRLVPTLARVAREEGEVEIPLAQVQVGDLVVVRPGEALPIDGEVVSGQATLDQAAITGESMPVEVAKGSHVFAATFVRLGSVHVRTTQVGAETTFGRVIRLVEEAEAHRADVQRVADRFSTYFLPFVAGIALLTFLLSHHLLATAAVLVVACSCSLALATPLAMLASIGAAARRGILIKGGKYLEQLARADVVLLDKTGTVTRGRPRITDIVPLTDIAASELLRLVASCERFSEHPLAEAVRLEALTQGIPFAEPEDFVSIPGYGVRARIEGAVLAVGNLRMHPDGRSVAEVQALEAQGKTLLLVTRNETLIGVLAASDTLRPEVPEALMRLRELGIQQIELLTGDHERTARSLAEQLGIASRANLLPEDKIAVVKAYQACGKRVVMVGDGINDAPALAQAEVGIAMGGMGTDVAREAAHIILMRDDWTLVPEVLALAQRTMRVVRMNIAFTLCYNLLGLSLAAFGFLPPVVAAAAQSLPDLGILANTARLLRQPQQKHGGTQKSARKGEAV